MSAGAACGHEWCAPGDECRRNSTIDMGGALDAIAAVLNGQEWDADTTHAIAAIVRMAGWEVRDVG